MRTMIKKKQNKTLVKPIKTLTWDKTFALMRDDNKRDEPAPETIIIKPS